MDYEKIIAMRNDNPSYAQHIGIRITALQDGFARGELQTQSEMGNPGDTLHGGVMFTLADTVAGVAAWSYGYFVTTVDASFHFLRKGIPGEKLIAEGTVLKKGSRIHVVEVVVKNTSDVVLCKGLMNFATLDRVILPDEPM